MKSSEDDVTGAPDHPSPALLAAHAERRLSASEAVRVESHLANCSRCFEEFAETVRFTLEEGEEESALPSRKSVVPFVQRPAFRWAAGLAAAAIVAFGVLQVYRARPKPPQPSLVADLAEAMGTRRFIEPRVTGGFQHGRLVVLRSGDAPQGLDAHSPAVLAAVARIRAAAEKDASPDALDALATTYLVSGDVAAAIKALESATEQAPKNVRLLSDLAAAYLVRASRMDEPADLPKALEVAERAIEQPSPPVEAYFNRALALERLHLVDAARRAWDDYLERDSTSGWADEARSHRDELPTNRQSTIEEDRARVVAALAEGTTAVDRLAAEAPSLLRDYFQDVVLPAWAEDYLAGHSEATRYRVDAETLGEALLAATGDALPRDTAGALTTPESPTAAGDPHRAQAEGFLALQEGQRLAAAVEPSCSPTKDAYRDLQAGGSPHAVWARFWITVRCCYPSDLKQAMAQLARVEEAAANRHHGQVLGLAHWMQGLLLCEGGSLTLSLEKYRLARDDLGRVGEDSQTAGLSGRIAQNLGLLGASREAWRDRLLALRALGRLRRVRDRQPILEEAVEACLGDSMPHSGLHFADEVVAATLGSSAAQASEALLQRASLYNVLGAPESAARDLADADRRIRDGASKDVLTRLRAEADVVRAAVLSPREPEEAVSALRSALAHYRPTAPALVPGLELRLGRLLLALGNGDAAELEFSAGIREMERQSASMTDPARRVSHFDQGQPLYEDMAQLRVVKGDPEGALELVERARARQLLEALGTPRLAVTTDRSTLPLDQANLKGALPPNVTLLYYLTLPDRLFAWALSNDGCEFVQRPLAASRLQELIARHRAGLELPAVESAVRETGGLLFEELIRPLLPVLSTQTVLIVVPDSTVQLVPFASLIDGRTGRYLIEDHVLGVSPSGTLFVRASRQASSEGRPRQALVLGNPTTERGGIRLAELPGAEEEATEIAALYESARLLTRQAATRAVLLDGIRHSDVVHFAGHAGSGSAPDSPAWLGLAGEDGSAREASSLQGSELSLIAKPRARLVVLAACRTASGYASPTEGALSLGRGFLAAGVSSVVSSLWDVDDETSRRFFTHFHRSFIDLGDPLLALRETQTAFLEATSPDRHPAHWALFVGLGGLDRRKIPVRTPL